MSTRLLALAAVVGLSTHAHAAFHVMQIEEIVGGVNGDASAQAIQLRMRADGQTQVAAARIRAWDSQGLNPVVLLDIASNLPSGANNTAGSNILLTTAAFNTKMSSVSGYVTDYVLANVIPASYLAGGKITFESDGGTIYWSVAFGSYTGSNTGDSTNGTFGTPFVSALPTANRQGIRFTGAAAAASTSNSTDYALTANPATVRNNAGTSFTVVPEPGTLGSMALGLTALGGLLYGRRRR